MTVLRQIQMDDLSALADIAQGFPLKIDGYPTGVSDIDRKFLAFALNPFTRPQQNLIGRIVILNDVRPGCLARLHDELVNLVVGSG